MLQQIFAITIKDLKILFKDRGGMITLFAMPMMFILVMSVALQGAFNVGGEDNPVDVLVVDLDQPATYIDGNDTRLSGDVLDAIRQVGGLRLISEWDGAPLTRDRAEGLIAEGSYQMAIIFPENFTARIVDSLTTPEASTATILFVIDPTASQQMVAPVQAAVSAYANRTAAYAQAPYRIEVALHDAAANFPAEQAPFVAQVGEALTAELIAVYDLGEIGGQSEIAVEQTVPAEFNITEFPDSVEQNVPGYTIFGVFFIVQVLATSQLREKQDGTFRRLLTAPLPRAALLMGKLLPYYLVNLIQVALMFAIGALVFDMNLGTSPAALILVTLATAAAATGMGLLVASFGKTPEQIGGLSTLLALTLAAIGGMMVPTFVMPEFMQTISKVAPHAWALAGYQDVIVRGLGVQAVLPEAGVLMGFAVIFFGIAVWRFRFD